MNKVIILYKYCINCINIVNIIFIVKNDNKDNKRNIVYKIFLTLCINNYSNVAANICWIWMYFETNSTKLLILQNY